MVCRNNNCKVTVHDCARIDVLDTFLLLVLLQTVKWFDRFLSNLRLTFVGCVWDLGSHTDQVGKCVAFSSDMKDFSYVCVII